MKTKKYWLIAALVAAICGVTFWKAQGALINHHAASTPKELMFLLDHNEEETDAVQRELLAGLTKFGIVYDVRVWIPNETDVDGQPVRSRKIERELRAAVELKLRLVGLPIISDEEWRQTLTKPVLKVTSTLMVFEKSKCMVMVEVSLWDKYTLKRNPDIKCYHSSWTHVSSSESSLDISTSPEKSGELAKAAMDKFINDYLAVNPKEPAAKENSTEERPENLDDKK